MAFCSWCLFGSWNVQRLIEEASRRALLCLPASRSHPLEVISFSYLSARGALVAPFCFCDRAGFFVLHLSLAPVGKDRRARKVSVVKVAQRAAPKRFAKCSRLQREQFEKLCSLDKWQRMAIRLSISRMCGDLWSPGGDVTFPARRRKKFYVIENCY